MSARPRKQMNPNHLPAPCVASAPVELLPQLLEAAHQAITAHKAARPSNFDIPAITRHARELDSLEGRLRALQNQERQQWRPAPERKDSAS